MEDRHLTSMNALDRRLRGEAWFTAGWKTRIDTFPTSGGAGLQLYRAEWFNDDGMGIHFETWITDKEEAKKSVRIVMHVLHQDTFPGTKLKRSTFSKPFLAQARDLVEGWEGYKLSNSTMKVLSRDVRYEEDATDQLVEEFGRVQELGSIVDRILEEVVSAR
jgi:hypothetical protein